MPLFSGRILQEPRAGAGDDPDGFDLDAVAPVGWVEVDSGRLVARGSGEPERAPDASGWILPAPVNAHTHVGDAFLRGSPGIPVGAGALAAAVGPGGWKAQRLARAGEAEMAQGVLGYTAEMAAIGTTAFLDFREGGLAGVRQVAALELPLTGLLFGRPAAPAFDEAEIEDLLEECHGIGLSARRDFPRPGDVADIAEACHQEGKPFALHASEAVREGIDDILALEPAFLVHCSAAQARDWEKVADAGVPVVVCPRSNARFGIRTPVPAMLAAGLELALGTDNGMLQDGDLRAEMAQLAAWYPDIPQATLLRMAVRGRTLAGCGSALGKPGSPVDLVVWPDLVPAASGKPALAPRQDAERL